MEQETHIGRRIVGVSTFFKKLQEFSNHGPLGCNLNAIDIAYYMNKNGPMSIFIGICIIIYIFF